MNINQPYPGLRPYQENEKDRFFGRDDDCRILVDKLLANRLTLLFAASGVGKSSLLNAAVLPYLKDPLGENLTVICHRDWVTNPLEGLITTITDEIPKSRNFKGATNLSELLAFCTLFTRYPLVLVLDQFEEFFRYQRGKEGFQTFVEQLTRVILDTDLPVNMVISMREDFALELNTFKPQLPTLLFENYYRLERMTLEHAQEAIVAPLKPLGFEYDEKLLEQLLEDLGKRRREGDGLPNETITENVVEPPYLQIVCERLWELNRANPDKIIHLSSYVKAGRDEGILTDFLHKALTRFNDKEKKTVSRAFDYLAAQRGVKIAYPLNVLANITKISEKRLQPVLDKLQADDVRILNRRERRSMYWYELYHDMFSAAVERWNDEWKTKQLRHARWRNGIGLTIFTALMVLLADGYSWVNRNYFPVDYLFQLQKFRLMNWGLLAEPLPEMVKIPMPDGEVRTGEYDEALAENFNGQLKASGSYSRQNFGNPVISVKLTEPFEMGKFEVTYEQYDYFVWQQRKAVLNEKEIAYPTGATRDNGRGNKALTQVSWDDAVKYTEWLSKKTGDTYRLPTEAQWEYAARAGTETAYWWGDNILEGRANCANCDSQWDDQFIAPVGQFAANNFGLHDTAGNVWEWTCSEWQSELDDSADTCSDDSSDRRVIRGGSWGSDTVWLRSSARYWLYTYDRDAFVGFRVIRLPRTQ